MTRIIQFIFRVILFLEKRSRRFEKKETIDYQSIKRILLVNTTALGDTLMSTPAIRAVRKAFPHASIASLVHSKQQEVLRDNPRIDELILYHGKYKRLFRLISTLRKKNFDMVIVFHANDPDIVPIVYMTGARYRAGWAESKLSFLLTHTFKRPEGKKIHVIEQRFGVLRSIGIEPDGVAMEYSVDEKDRVFADAFLKRNNILPAEFLIGLHPFGSLQSKSWPNYIGFLEKISVNQKIKLILFGGKVHKREFRQHCPDLDHNIFPVVGKTSIGETAALIGKCRVFVTTDSGPFHLAVALKSPTILLVGPTVVKVTGPYQDKEIHRVIKEDVDCAPCRLKKCDDHICMKAITPERVMKELKSFLAGKEAGGIL